MDTITNAHDPANAAARMKAHAEMEGEGKVSPSQEQVTVTLSRAAATHLLALALQFAITERLATVSRQINADAMRELNRVLG